MRINAMLFNRKNFFELMDERRLANKSRQRGEEIICPVCGDIVTKKSTAQVYCTEQCRHNFWDIRSALEAGLSLKDVELVFHNED